jgi:uncharacterized Tic20 family protein
MNSNYSSDERLMAAIAHASVVTSGPGILIGVVIWLTQKERSAFASWQGLHAAICQLIGMITIVALWVLWGLFFGLMSIPMMMSPQQPAELSIVLFVIGISAMIIPLVLIILWILYGLYGAFQCWQGRDFRYALIGKFIPQSSRLPSERPPPTG